MVVMDRPEPEIRFHYDGVNYVVGMQAYDLNKIVLPDGRVLEATGWYESYPPQPDGLVEVPHLFTYLSLGEIAHNLGAAIAQRRDT